MLAHSHDFRNDRIIRPFHPKYLGEFLKILSRSLTDGEDGVTQPAHAQATKLLVEKLHAKLGSEEGNVFNNRQPDAPLLVPRQVGQWQVAGTVREVRYR